VLIIRIYQNISVLGVHSEKIGVYTQVLLVNMKNYPFKELIRYIFRCFDHCF